jgi:kynurenine formamidase
MTQRIDAQKHAIQGGMAIDHYPLDRFYGPAGCLWGGGPGRNHANCIGKVSAKDDR